MLGRPQRPLGALARALDPPTRLPRRVARPAGDGGRARTRLRRDRQLLRIRPARQELRAHRAIARAELAERRLPALGLTRPRLRTTPAATSARPRAACRCAGRA